MEYILEHLDELTEDQLRVVLLILENKLDVVFDVVDLSLVSLTEEV